LEIFFKSYFDEVTLAKTIYNPYIDDKEELYQKILFAESPNKILVK